ncbi:MAG TPA: hypothetical protein VNO50_10925 [Pyrinomonadaceae bacterium]|nr:hypothetical protein [Pyrinomonadaceae bacterium]
MKRVSFTAVLDEDGKYHCVYVGTDPVAATAAMENHGVAKPASVARFKSRRPDRLSKVVQAWVTESVDLSVKRSQPVAPVSAPAAAEEVSAPVEVTKSKAPKAIKAQK